MTAPLVAVVGYHLEPGRVTRWRHGAYAVPDAYVDAVRRAGGLPAVIHPDDVDLDRTDAVLLIGGGDVDPARYGHAGDAAVYGVEPARDAAEIALIHGAIERRLPLLGICRAIQVINVAFGGTLVVDLATAGGYRRHGEPGGDADLHDVKVEPGSALAAACGADVVTASCHHHQGVDRVGDGLVPTAWAADGLVEALERPGDSWLVSVQWHPEDTAADDPAQQGLFNALLEAVSKT
ncbi:MAG TPA: gamma-glutamyl-gamma-aminobutyrate hydrolase family protein [Acidimicrobiales bacterium]|nr:gamma-glutamyl-gamma-aminobutyrate hydrolase family protein [Acidimicrobiales bacterium]